MSAERYENSLRILQGFDLMLPFFYIDEDDEKKPKPGRVNEIFHSICLVKLLTATTVTSRTTMKKRQQHENQIHKICYQTSLAYELSKDSFLAETFHSHFLHSFSILFSSFIDFFLFGID